MTTNQPSDPAAQATLVATTYAYDPAGHLTSIDTGSEATLVRFGIDALGRHAGRSIGPVGTETAVTTYAYLGTSDAVSSSRTVDGSAPPVTTLTYSAIDAIGNRLTSGTAAAFAYLLPDLHGNVVATMTGGSAPAFSAAYRYDAYGVTCDSYAPSGAIASPWRYQGRILESADGTADLYDFSARSYDPGLGAFTSFDSVSGSAQNPLTLNRYLYANANPARFIDPTGHAVEECGFTDGGTWTCQGAGGPGGESTHLNAAKRTPNRAYKGGPGGTAVRSISTSEQDVIAGRKYAIHQIFANSRLLNDDGSCDDLLRCVYVGVDHGVRSFAYAPIATVNAIGDIGNICMKGSDFQQCVDAVNPINQLNQTADRIEADINNGNWADLGDVGGSLLFARFGAKAAGPIAGKIGGLTDKLSEALKGASKGGAENAAAAAAEAADAAPAGAVARAGGSEFTPDQGALVELAKAAKAAGLSEANAYTLLEWAEEYGLPTKGSYIHVHDWIGADPHIHIGPVNHIGIR